MKSVLLQCVQCDNKIDFPFTYFNHVLPNKATSNMCLVLIQMEAFHNWDKLHCKNFDAKHSSQNNASFWVWYLLKVMVCND